MKIQADWKPNQNSIKPFLNLYHKTPKNLDTRNICGNQPKIQTRWRLKYRSVMHPKDVDRMGKSVDPDQTAPLEAVWYGSTLFAQAYLSKNLGILQ